MPRCPSWPHCLDLFSSVLPFNLSVSFSFYREYTQNGPLHHANTFILCPAAAHEYGVHTPSSDTGDSSSMMTFNSPCSHYCSLEGLPRTVPACIFRCQYSGLSTSQQENHRYRAVPGILSPQSTCGIAGKRRPT